jgi:DNA-binding PadR family transcriptional regulator
MPPSSDLPLSETTFLILLSLAPGAKHGYAIQKDVQALSEGRVRLGTGTLYGAIKRLLEQGWIERAEDPQPNETERQRKAYRLTRLGRRLLEAESARLEQLAAIARLRTAREQP